MDYEGITAARDEVELTEERYLKERGWKHTCTTPGSYWLWQKTLPDGRTVIVGRAQAIRMAQALDEL